MRLPTLDDWLAWQETLHPKAIDLSLERIRDVQRRLNLTRPAPTVITVAGTNGKGSCVAILEAILHAAGYRAGTYTSPHLRRYNERIRLHGAEVSDAQLIAAFERVDSARGDTTLSYFEFGTLAALDLMERARLDAAVLEVGLGGRLDAVNIVDADCALITTIGLDHVDWLGPDLESIAAEKAGIMRPCAPAVFGQREAPPALLQKAREIGAIPYRLGEAFDYRVRGDHWDWRGGERRYNNLPMPFPGSAHQLDNAAACLMVLQTLRDRLQVSSDSGATGITSARLPGRMQRLDYAGVEVILDVAHNPQAAVGLAAALQQLPPRRPQVAVFAQLNDKDHAGVAQALREQVSHWYLADLPGARGLSACQLADAISSVVGRRAVSVCAGFDEALAGALNASSPNGRIVVFGSFRTVGAVTGLITG